MSKKIIENRPIKNYQNESFQKSKYTQELEKRLVSIMVDNDIYQKTVNTTVKTLSKLNPCQPLTEIESLIDMIVVSVESNNSLKEIKSTMNLINSKLENLIKPKEDIVTSKRILKKIRAKIMGYVTA